MNWWVQLTYNLYIFDIVCALSLFFCVVIGPLIYFWYKESLWNWFYSVLYGNVKIKGKKISDFPLIEGQWPGSCWHVFASSRSNFITLSTPPWFLFCCLLSLPPTPLPIWTHPPFAIFLLSLTNIYFSALCGWIPRQLTTELSILITPQDLRFTLLFSPQSQSFSTLARNNFLSWLSLCNISV